MAIPVNGSGVESSSSAIRLTAVQDAIRSRHFADLANIIDTLELEGVLESYVMMNLEALMNLKLQLEIHHHIRFWKSLCYCTWTPRIAASGSPKPQDWPYAAHILSHVVNNDLNSARFVWKRMPAAVKADNPELVAAWKIVQSMWTHDHAGVYESLKGYDWNPLVLPVTQAIGDDYSMSMLKLLSIAYSTVSVVDASGFLGLSENETVTFLTQQHGWVLDPATQMLTVRPMSTVADKKTDSSQLQNLTEYVFHLEH